MKHDWARREFFGLAAMAVARLALGGEPQPDTGPSQRSRKSNDWTIGCFNRPWGRWTYDEALRGIQSAGFRVTGLLGDHANEQFILPEAGREYLHALKQRIESSGLSINLAFLRTNYQKPFKEVIRTTRTQIDNATKLGVRFLLATGADRPDAVEHSYRVLADSAEYAADRKIQIVLKPHGGSLATANDMLRCIKHVDHPNLRIWYDAGNIIHYTGADPVADVEQVASYVTGFCAKDCATKKGDVMIQFGKGNVDFHGVFRKLKQAKFQGPVMIECCAGRSWDEVTDSARNNRLFLEQLFTSLGS